MLNETFSVIFKHRETYLRLCNPYWQRLHWVPFQWSDLISLMDQWQLYELFLNQCCQYCHWYFDNWPHYWKSRPKIPILKNRHFGPTSCPFSETCRMLVHSRSLDFLFWIPFDGDGWSWRAACWRWRRAWRTAKAGLLGIQWTNEKLEPNFKNPRFCLSGPVSLENLDPFKWATMYGNLRFIWK